MHHGGETHMHSWEKSAFVGLATAKIGVMADQKRYIEIQEARVYHQTLLNGI